MAVLKTGEAFPRHLLKEPLTRVRDMPIAILTLLAIFVVASACQVVGKFQSFSPHSCNVLPASKLDANLVTLVLSKQPDGTCYWIDKTEVTVQQYSKFLTEVGAGFSGNAAFVPPAGWETECGWKATPSDPAAQTNDPCTTSTSVESDPFATLKPIRCVDWCDARAFCIWAGKDLCGGITNGSFNGPLDVPDRWGGACSDDGLPYVNGSMAVSGVCNVGLSEVSGQCSSLDHQNACAPTTVGSFPECAGPSGAVDMIGNVAEWVVSCELLGDGGPDTSCQHRGGSFADDLAASTCYATTPDSMSTRDRHLGLRCCAALTADELKAGAKGS